ncbi:MAG: bifunctional proline dehydrogenase/L-glutamate gamma-semialdehyde dehydrogenase [SAR324 cluster bacterium]|nr:bifunctional proline dehydrogenase/L-glutamate gamma-semialdehyde dehydrogenase [SAR324 cluster bacterium]MBL7034615.1 bifunctional proline dehydrogenase/L-glutamate gamma-semialdehyde dehydrogenase [SAR324 cluster bacterium]
MNKTDLPEILHKSLALAENWQKRANTLRTKDELTQQQMMRRLLQNPSDKTVVMHLIDQSFRSGNPRRVVDQFRYLLQHHGIPRFFPQIEQWLLKIFLHFGSLVPQISHSQILRKIREDTRRTILPEELEFLKAHLNKRLDEGVQVNLNHLGEAVLGEGEAQNRLQHYGDSLRNPDIHTISIKISNIVAQLHPLGFENELELICKRLSELYRIALENPVTHSDGTRHPKFVNLDMEAYHDLDLTMSAFMRTLDQPEFKDLEAGIVLQAYLPDSYLRQQELIKWAKKRVKNGGSPVKMRLVKGANLVMEAVEAEVFGWPLTVYDSKIETDANFKRMLEYGLQPENIAAVHFGLASHNLFDLAYTKILAEEQGVSEGLVFEMLEGMADHVRRTIQEENLNGEKDKANLLLYTPVTSKDNFISAIAYLVRRLDENTSPDNFLRHSFDIRVGSGEWQFLENQFLEAWHLKDKIAAEPRRQQNRNKEIFPEKIGTFADPIFRNEADTDWVLPENQKWAEKIRKKWMPTSKTKIKNIPLYIGKTEIKAKRKQHLYFDPSQPDVPAVYTVALATKTDVIKAVKIAKDDPSNWRQTTRTGNSGVAERHELLSVAAMNMRKRRGDLIGIAAAVCGKTFYESDPEISEAIDFIEYYPHSLSLLEKQTSLKLSPQGVVLVIPPWNFPIAIPTGGVAAALAAGNTVLFKPSPLAFPLGLAIAECFWDAGIPREALQLVTCEDGEPIQTLSGHSDVDAIIFTGGTKTALELLEKRPDAELSAETGGKNATIVTAMADRDQAVEHILHSAFSHSGQKCSATSLLVLEKEVYEDEIFRKQLLDAIQTLKVGSVWNFSNKMGPLIREPLADLRKGFETLGTGERWALPLAGEAPPKCAENNPKLWQPAVKWGVRRGSYSHQTEFFGPLLSVMRAESLEDAIEIVNDTPYGLTSGLESLDPREQKIWTEKILAGNLYINRVTTGAIVLRQPFGGMGLSAIGAGIKAGSPNYAMQFCKIEESDMPTQGPLRVESPLQSLARNWQTELIRSEHAQIRNELHKTIQAIYSCLFQYESEFSGEQDFFRLRGQDNLFRYLPVGKVTVRLHKDDGLFETLIRIAAARIAKCEVEVSLHKNLKNSVTEFLSGKDGQRLCDSVKFCSESDKELSVRLSGIDRLRYAHPDRVPQTIHQAAAKLGKHVSRHVPLAEGRIEMLRYLREQSISSDYHRYGNLGERDL